MCWRPYYPVRRENPAAIYFPGAGITMRSDFGVLKRQRDLIVLDIYRLQAAELIVVYRDDVADVVEILLHLETPGVRRDDVKSPA